MTVVFDSVFARLVVNGVVLISSFVLEGAECSNVLRVFEDTALSGTELVFSREVPVGYKTLLEELEVRELFGLLKLLAFLEDAVVEFLELTEVPDGIEVLEVVVVLELDELTFDSFSSRVVIVAELLAVTGELVRTSLDFEDRSELTLLTFTLVV